MPDPFLLAHHVGPLLFDIGGRISPISIRDQMIRGRVLVDRAVEAGLINNDFPMLVIGAGAAGATAAIRGVQHGIRTMLIDQASAPFLRQRGCRSRFIDPTQYDWPVVHWQEGRYHWDLPNMPLAWSRGFAADIALRWMARLNLARLLFPNLYVRYNMLALRSWPSGGRRGIVVQFNRPPHQIMFGMVILCAGFGTEKCSIDDHYSSFQFWDPDDFELPNLNLTAHQLPAQILVSGGGDGALQDFLRIVTSEPAGTYDKSPRHIYEKLKGAIDGLTKQQRDDVQPAWDKVWCEVENELQSAEDQANRAYIWGNDADHDHDVHERLHKAHEKAVQKLWTLWGKTSTWKLIDDAMDLLLRTSLPKVKLVYPCTHFSQCYGLNRFLVILFERYLSERRKNNNVVLERGKRVLRVTGVDPHSCANNPAACHGEKHEVTILDSNCFKKTISGTDKTEYFNVIIIRHGVDPPQKTRIAFPRQILPYYAAS